MMLSYNSIIAFSLKSEVCQTRTQSGPGYSAALELPLPQALRWIDDIASSLTLVSLRERHNGSDLPSIAKRVEVIVRGMLIAIANCSAGFSYTVETRCTLILL